MDLTDQITERRRFKRYKVNKRPIVVLGPDPVRVGHVTSISDEAAEILFSDHSWANLCGCGFKFTPEPPKSGMD